MQRLFSFRFPGGEGLAGHSLGNLLLTGLDQLLGGFDRAVEEASYILSVRGEVLPATLDRADLVARMEDGAEVSGEVAIVEDSRAIQRIGLSTPVRPHEPVLDALQHADLITLGPGSLFTSVIPSLLVDGIAQAIGRSPADRYLIMNLMTQPGETQGFTAHDHLRVLRDYIDIRKFSAVIVNTQPPPEEILERYRAEGSIPVIDDLRGPKAMGLRVIRAPLLALIEVEGRPTIKHDPAALGRVIAAHAPCFRRSWTRWFPPRGV